MKKKYQRTAQVDFGKAPFKYLNEIIELPVLVMSFPHANTFVFFVKYGVLIRRSVDMTGAYSDIFLCLTGNIAGGIFICIMLLFYFALNKYVLLDFGLTVDTCSRSQPKHHIQNKPAIRKIIG